MRISELEDKLKKNEYHAMLLEMEERLERTENEFIKSRVSETALRKELLSVQSKNVNLKVDNELLNKTRKTRRFSKAIELPEMGDPTSSSAVKSLRRYFIPSM